MEPQLLIADEAVSALDVSVQAQVLKLLDDVRRRFDLAVLFITHDLRVAAQICDRIAVMQRGVVVEQGPTAEVFAAPAARIHARAVRGRARPQSAIRRRGGISLERAQVAGSTAGPSFRVAVGVIYRPRRHAAARCVLD